MHILLILLVILVVVLAIVLIGAALLPEAYQIECQLTIDRPAPEVFNFVRYLKNQPYYNKWVMMDPDCKREYAGTDGAVGGSCTWDSQNKQVGSGRQEITKVIEGERVDSALHFVRPFEGRADTYMTTTAIGTGQTLVKWGLSGLRSYPNRIMHFILNLKKMLTKDVETGLMNLKKVLEK